jgi:hypothetical protein
VLNGGDAHCVGTVADRSASVAPSPGSLSIGAGRAHLDMTVWPLLAIFAPSMQVEADLSCTRDAPVVSCSGAGRIEGVFNEVPVSIRTTGTSDGSLAVIRLDDGPPPATVTTPAPTARAKQSRRHRRRHPHSGLTP